MDHDINVIPAKKPPAEVRSQILVLVAGGPQPYLINPGDEVTGVEGRTVEYPKQVLDLLSDSNTWLDLWVDSENDQGEKTKIGVRLFGRSVIHLTQAFVFPDDKDAVQA